jgi:hypothetical protein
MPAIAASAFQRWAMEYFVFSRGPTARVVCATHANPALRAALGQEPV